MNVYDFDNTIYDGDSTADFYIFCLKRHKKILTLLPKLAGAFAKFYVFKKGTKTQFKQVMFTFLKFADFPQDLEDFWELHRKKIKKWCKMSLKIKKCCGRIYLINNRKK